MIDRVIKYESLTDELAEIFARLGVPFHDGLQVRAKADSRPKRQPYRAVYTDAQKDVIAKAFAKEIEMHG
jgi:hypothetical protein